MAPTRNLGAQLGASIRAQREAVGWSQARLAELTGVSANYVGVVERGEKLPTLETLDAFASALGTSLSAFFHDPRDKASVQSVWADEIAALARAVPPLHRQIVLALLKAAANDARSPRATATKRAARPRGSARAPSAPSIAVRERVARAPSAGGRRRS